MWACGGGRVLVAQQHQQQPTTPAHRGTEMLVPMSVYHPPHLPSDDKFAASQASYV